MIHKLFLLMLFLGIAIQSDAQTFSISGTVRDKQGTLPGASIYLSNYKNATSTNSDGKFVLSGLKPGNYDVLVQMMGYLPFTKNVIISDRSVNIEIVLKDNTVMLNEVVIRTDPNRERYLNMFKEFFIGKTPNAEKCKILNPAVLNIDYDGDARTLTVKSNDFLIIENKALGYKLRYMLQFFEYNYNTRIVYYAGLPTFEDLKGSKSKMRGWVKNREAAYYGSSQQFFKSLYAGTSKEDGFIINKMIKVPNDQRPPDSIINKNIKRLSKSLRGTIPLPGSSASDSLMYWSKVKNMPAHINILNRAEVLTDTLVRQDYKNLKTMNFKDQLYVMYTKERESVDFTNFSGHSVNRPLDIPNYEISIINMLQAPLHFYENGGIYEAKSILYEGYWAYEKIADMVPMDYIPVTKK